MNRWRRGRLPALLVALLVLVPTAVVLITATRSPARALDPASAAPSGARALAQVLAGQGVEVERVERVSAARRELARARGEGAGRRDTLVVTDPGVLASAKLRQVSAAAARVVLLDPSAGALRALTPALGLRTGSDAGSTSSGGATTTTAGCDDPAALAAGTITGDGVADRELRRAAHAPSTTTTDVCFAGTYATAAAGGLTVAALTEPSVVANRHLAQAGNAALALRMIGARPRVVWLVASPLDAPATGGRPLTDLLPAWVGSLVVQLVLVALAAVLWRSRRLGALVTEPLPVVVRAAETVEGRAALYRSAGSPAASAAALRAAARWRLAARLGLPAGASGEQVVAAVRAVTGTPDARAALLGPAPASDSALVALADDLDAVEEATSPRPSTTTTPRSTT